MSLIIFFLYWKPAHFTHSTSRNHNEKILVKYGKISHVKVKVGQKTSSQKNVGLNLIQTFHSWTAWTCNTGGYNLKRRQFLCLGGVCKKQLHSDPCGWRDYHLAHSMVNVVEYQLLSLRRITYKSFKELTVWVSYIGVSLCLQNLGGLEPGWSTTKLASNNMTKIYVDNVES